MVSLSNHTQHTLRQAQGDITMIKKTHNSIPFYEFEIFQDFKGILKHAVFTRLTNINDQKIIKKALDTDAEPVAFKEQMHGTNVLSLRGAERQSNLLGDSLITAESNTPLVIRIADCASILIFDPRKKVIANIHAGWKGIAARIIHKTIDSMRKRFGCESKNLLCAISPMVGPCCCRFSDPEKELPKYMHTYISEENTVDLWAAVESHLRECGVPKKNIENPRICTFCNPEEFFSYRRDGNTGRFGTAIMLK
jgi:hypothetical protein